MDKTCFKCYITIFKVYNNVIQLLTCLTVLNVKKANFYNVVFTLIFFYVYKYNKKNVKHNFILAYFVYTLYFGVFIVI